MTSNGRGPTAIPALSPPVGERTNFINPYSLYSVLIATVVICLIFTTLGVLVRVASSLRAFKLLLAEDCMHLAQQSGPIAKISRHLHSRMGAQAIA